MREIDVQALQEEMQVGYWELVNGEDTVYRDSRAMYMIPGMPGKTP